MEPTTRRARPENRSRPLTPHRRSRPPGEVDVDQAGRATAADEPSDRPASAGRKGRRVFGFALAGGLLLWASFPPLGFWPLVWIAPVFWLLLVRDRSWRGNRPYLAIWLAAWLHWLLMLEGIRRAHPALYLGWIALSAYLAVYPVLFVGLTRVAIFRCRIPLILAAPVVWTGLELARGHILSGFSVALLGHALAEQTTLIQIADLFGAYGVSFLVMMVAACLAQMLPISADGRKPHGWSWWPIVPAAVAVVAAWMYAQPRMSSVTSREETDQTLAVALVQGAHDTRLPMMPERAEREFQRYRELSRRAAEERPLDLIIWPESAYTGALGDMVIEEEPIPPEGLSIDPEEYRLRAWTWAEAFRAKCADVAEQMNSTAREDATRREPQTLASGMNSTTLIVGSDTQLLKGTKAPRYNSALQIAADGRVVQRYYKVHRVAFGEYIPFGEFVPLLYELTPIGEGIAAGSTTEAFRVNQAVLSPSICFESTVPHLIRRQVNQLRAKGQPPQVLVNLTNDGWFWGASILDLHLSCAVFRAIEHRLPMLVAANTGISAWIDGNGSILSRGPRRQEAILHADVPIDATPPLTYYQRWGDIFAWISLSACVALAIVSLLSRQFLPVATTRME